MKYLKSFNESFNEVDETLKDICLELEDDGFYTEMFTIKVNGLKYNGYTVNDTDVCGSIGIKKFNKTKSYPDNMTFLYEDIKECIDRVKDYLGDRFISEDFIWLDGDMSTNLLIRVLINYRKT